MTVVQLFVAIGTLALAGSTYWLARTTRLTLQEMYRARVDAIAPSVTIVVGETTGIVPDPVMDRAVTMNAKVLRISDVDLADLLDEAMGLRFNVSLRNEGRTSAVVQFSYYGFDGSVTDSPGYNEFDIKTELTDRWYLVPPEEERSIEVTWLRQVRDWRSAAESGDLLDFESSLTVMDSRKQVSDQWKLFVLGAMFIGQLDGGWLLGTSSNTRIAHQRRGYDSGPRDPLALWWEDTKVRRRLRVRWMKIRLWKRIREETRQGQKAEPPGHPPA